MTIKDPTGEEVKIPAKIRKEIEAHIRTQAKAKALESEAKILKSEAKDNLIPLMAAYSIKSYEVGGLGKTFLKVNSGSSINGAKLREELLVRGVGVDVINEAIEAATKTWATEYVDFVPERG